MTRPRSAARAVALAAAALALLLPAAASAQSNAFGYQLLTGLPLDYIPPPAAQAPLTGVAGPLFDDEVVAVTLPWAFPYYSGSYTQLWVVDNGGIRFDVGTMGFGNTCLPTFAFFGFDSPDVSVHWDDLDISSGGAIYAWEDSASGRFVVSWENIPLWGASTPADGGTFQVHLDSSGNIEAHYLDLDFDGASTFNDDALSATLGIQEQVGVLGFVALDPLQYSCDTARPTLEGTGIAYSLCTDGDGDGFGDVACGGTDCDDLDPAINPSALEVCDDGVDDDCDGADLVGDSDNDGFDSDACVGGTDCDDTDPAVNPGVDGDNDGWDACADCDDGEPGTNPGAVDVCGNGIDEDCSGVDDGDNDGDGYFALVCGGVDCDDTDPAINPGVDGDNDGYDACADCDDGDAAINPAATEVCDGLDNDCDGLVDPLDGDGDGDSPPSCGGGDCDDTDPSISSLIDADEDGSDACADCDEGDGSVYPGAPEACDGADSDCDGLLDGQDPDAGGPLAPTLVVTPDGPPALLPTGWGAPPAESDLAVSVLGDAVLDLDVTLDISVFINFDVSVSLTSPEGTTVTLFAALEITGAHFTDTTLDDEAAASITTGSSPFTGSFVPENPLTAFDGEDPNGTWTLSVTEPSGVGGDLLGWHLTLTVETPDADADGWVDSCGDCDGSDPASYPGAPEVCGDGVDQDCDGADLLQDADADGFHDAACGGDDCDDDDPAVHPSADGDGDGFDACQDCDDGDASVFPGAAEVCGDGVDQDCDGADEGLDDDQDSFDDVLCGGDDCDDDDPLLNPFEDRDGDGFTACADCEDLDPEVNPGAIEACDGIDNDCSGAVDDRDLDGDGVLSPLCGGGEDCDDNNPDVPAEVEICGDGVDQDCDGFDIPADADGDGAISPACAGDDCDDEDATIAPGAPEVCGDGIDQDCDGQDDLPDDDGDSFEDAGCGGDDCDDLDPEVRPDVDADGDGASMCVDCDDADALRAPGLEEVCDGLDNDCDESVDENIFPDRDGDGFTRIECGGEDCMDGDPRVNPDGVELCGDGLDNDCDGATDAEDDSCSTAGCSGCGSSVGGGEAGLASLLLFGLIGLRRRRPVAPRTAAGLALLALLPGLALAQAPAEDLLSAMDINPASIVPGSVQTPGSQVLMFDVRDRLGPIVPNDPATMGLMSTGDVRTLGDQYVDYDYPGAGFDTSAGDHATLRVQLQVPSFAHSFAFDFNFLSREYPEYVGSIYNDTFEVQLTSGAFTGQIVFDSAGNPVTVNNGFFVVTQPGALVGTGFDSDGATGWVTTIAPVLPDEVITLTFEIYDQGDGILDSAVLLDRFRWSIEDPEDPSSGHTDDGGDEALEMAYISPKQGDVAGGEPVRVFGGGFDETTQVRWGGISAGAITLISDELLIIDSVPGASALGVAAGATVDVEVLRDGAVKALEAAWTYTEEADSEAAPRIDGVEPGRVHPDGGSEVRIRGEGFAAGARVLLVWTDAEGGVVETEAALEQGGGVTELRATTPEHPAAWVDLVVENPSGLRSSPGYPLQVSASAIPPQEDLPVAGAGEGRGCSGSVVGRGSASLLTLALLLGAALGGRRTRGSALLLLGLPLLASGCDETGLRAVPNEAPIAVAMVLGEGGQESRIGRVVLGQDARLDGSASIDPDLDRDEVLEYRWTLLSRPPGSAAELAVPEGTPERPSLRPDLEGTYRVELVVVDPDDAASLPSVVNVQAVPPSDLRVTLRWDATAADLDLHVVEPGGSYWGEGDCFAWNPTPDWGTQGLAEDDPTLDGDSDGEELGPYQEAISIRLPRSGDYALLVHYFADHSAALERPAVTALPQVFVESGGLPVGAWRTPGRVIGEGEVWQVGALRWPDAAVAPVEPEISTHADLGGPEVWRRP